jgi:hypothetical protein
MTKILKIPKSDVIFVNKIMTAKNITKELDRFHVDLTKEKSKQDPTARHIIATSSALAVGLTLGEAMTVAFLEPDFRPATTIQGYFRHCRQGNQNAKVYSWMFIASRSAVEERIQNVNNLRKGIIAAASRKTSEATRVDPMDIDEENLYDDV